MKKIVLFLSLALVFTTSVNANDLTDTTNLATADTVKKWTRSNTIIFTSEQAYYNNWSAGGFSSFSFSGYYKAFYKYKKGNHAWDNNFDLGYGQMIQDVTGNGFNDPANHFQKSEDKIDINSIYGYKVFVDWYASALLNVKSQFDNGYKYDNGDTTLVASTFSPAVLTSSVGLEYKKPSFSAMFSFLTGKTTFVGDNRLLPPSSTVLGFTEENTHWYFSLGSFVKFFFQKDIFKNVNLLGKLEFFYDYSKPFLDTDISGEVFINMKVNKYLTAFISVQAILDHDFNSTVQFKERFGISIPITF
ncbi:MAG: DUF3078 domain-containing protein [Bacteroidales bacterium]|jgi:hypothetical protein|nr:DUF3078 domain-containing protein [Bacteroidales bacterium]